MSGRIRCGGCEKKRAKRNERGSESTVTWSLKGSFGNSGTGCLPQIPTRINIEQVHPSPVAMSVTLPSGNSFTLNNIAQIQSPFYNFSTEQNSFHRECLLLSLELTFQLHLSLSHKSSGRVFNSPGQSHKYNRKLIHSSTYTHTHKANKLTGFISLTCRW